MTPHELYTLVLCMIVLVLFTSTFVYLIGSNFKMHTALIRLGQMDEQIKKEAARKKSRLLDILNRTLSWLMVIAVSAFFGFSLYVGYQQEHGSNAFATLQVVKSPSMQTAHEKNTYLVEDGVENRIMMFDLVLIRPLPAEEELEVYDIVVYERDDMRVIHRIEEIEEPGPLHEETYYRLQGDANRVPDEYPVYYDQMLGIYEGERIPFLGSFVLFMQSPAGWMCMTLIIATFIATGFVERKLKTQAQKRLRLISKETEAE